MPATFRARLAKTLLVAVQLVVGIALGISLAWWLHYTAVPGPLLVLALVVVLAVAAHEAGHWLGSRYAGLRCYTVAVLWLYLERRGPRWHLRLGKKRPGALGYVLALPTPGGPPRRRSGVWQQAWFIGAGPAASLGLGLLALGAGWWGPPGLVAESLRLFGVASLATGGLNLLPFSTRHGNVSDGEQLRRLYRGGTAAGQQQAARQLLGASYLGTRPRHWDAALLAQLLAAPPASGQACVAHLYAYAHYLDAANLPAAGQHLTQALAARPAASPALQQHLCTEAAYLALAHSHQPAEAARWLQAAAQAKPFAKGENHFARALLACTAGQWAQARQLLRTCTQETQKILDVGSREQALERLQELAALVARQELAASVAAVSDAL